MHTWDNPATPPEGTRVRRTLNMDSHDAEWYYMRPASVSELTIKASPQSGGDCTHDTDDNVCTDCYNEWAMDYQFELIDNPTGTTQYNYTPTDPNHEVRLPINLFPSTETTN